MNGILLVDKPAGFTSFDVIAKLRGILRMKRIGHGGTLDPMATGVLPVFLGEATKLCDLLPNQDKAYRASFQLGVVTDTQDCTGKVLSETALPVSREVLAGLLPRFTGSIQQIPPMYSAVQVGGRRLYDMAREGVEVDRPPRQITVYSLELTAYDQQTRRGELSIRCSKGSFVRTIVHDIGQVLGCGGILTALRRTEASGFFLKDCLTLEQIAQLTNDPDGCEKVLARLLPVDRAFHDLPAIQLTPKDSRLHQNGVRLTADIRGWTPAPLVRVYGADGRFLSLSTVTGPEEQEEKRRNLLIALRHFHI